jgi:hypothetical protein
MHAERLTEAVFTNSIRGKLSHFLWRYVKNQQRALKAMSSRVDGDVARISGVLRENGIVVENAAAFLSPSGMEALEKATAEVGEIAESGEVQDVVRSQRNAANNKKYLVHLVPISRVHTPESAFLKIGLDPRLLEIVGDYLGVWPRLISIGSWLNFPTPTEAQMSQLWHRDPEDYKMLKVFIYLEPVGEKNGPFSYIPRTQPFGAMSDKVPVHQHKRRILDEEMATIFPEESWLQCIGGKYTMVIADTVGFHRGGKVDEGRRLLITFTYTSGSPRENDALTISTPPAWADKPIQKYALKGAKRKPAA